MDKNALNQFICELRSKINATYREKITFDVLKNDKKILFLRSAKLIWLEKFLKQLAKVNINVQLDVIGKKSDKDVLEEYLGERYQLYHCEGSYNIQSLGEVIAALQDEKYDRIIFLNHTMCDYDYLAIEELVAELNEKRNVPIYTYSVTEELNEYNNICMHIKGLNLYRALVEWAWEER